METKHEFEVGDKVLAYYDGLLYRAKCLKRQVTDIGVKQYFIHYVGFKSRFDEWTDEDEVLEINSINLAHKERLESSRRLKGVKKPVVAQFGLRKRGRPSKHVKQTVKPVVQSGLRKRGRPSKHVKQTVEPVVQSGLRKRGRPSKHVKQTIEPVVQSGLRKRGMSEEILQNNAEPVVVQCGLRKRGRPRKHVKQTIEPVVQSGLRKRGRPSKHVKQTIEPVVQSGLRKRGMSEEIVQNNVEPVVLQSKIPAVEHTAIPFILIPCPKLLIKKIRSLKLPNSLQRMLELDYDLHKISSMVLKFPEEHFVAEVIFAFTKSSFFVENDNQKKYPMMFPATILKYFNESVHTHLIYENEKIFNSLKKGMEYFQERMIDQPNINYVFKSHLDSNMIWCYLYGPTHLLRLITNLPKILGSNSWHPGYDSNTFVLHIEQLIKFLDHNLDVYFSIDDYRIMDGKSKTRKLFDSSFFCKK